LIFQPSLDIFGFCQTAQSLSIFVLGPEEGGSPMAQEGFKRKLAAVLSADVKEYSRLMREDETATIRTLTAYREVMTGLIK